MFDFLVLAGVLGNLIYFAPERVNGDELFGFHLCLFTVALSFVFQPKRNISMPFVGFLLLTVIFTTLYQFRWPVRLSMVNFFMACLAIKTIAERTCLRVENLGKALIGYFCVNNAFLALQLVWKDSVYQNVYIEPAGTNLLPWIMGCVACLAMPFVQSVSPWACLLLVPAVFYSKSSFCAVLAAVSFCLPYTEKFKGRYIKTFGPLILAAVGYVFLFERKIDFSRGSSIIQTAAYVRDWWFGNGLGSFAHEAFVWWNGSDPVVWRWAHNEIYQYAFEQGRVGVFFLCAAITSVFLLARGKFIKIALLNMVLLAQIHPICHFSRTAWISMVIVAMALASYSKQGDLSCLDSKSPHK